MKRRWEICRGRVRAGRVERRLREGRTRAQRGIASSSAGRVHAGTRTLHARRRSRRRAVPGLAARGLRRDRGKRLPRHVPRNGPGRWHCRRAPARWRCQRNPLESKGPSSQSAQTKNNSFRYLKTSPEIIRLAVMMYIRYPLSLRQVEDIIFERGIDINHEAIRYWWNRFCPMFAGEIRKRRKKGRNFRSDALSICWRDCANLLPPIVSRVPLAGLPAEYDSRIKRLGVASPVAANRWGFSFRGAIGNGPAPFAGRLCEFAAEKIVMIETFRKALTALSVAERTRRSSGCEPGRPLWRKRHHHEAFPMNR